MFPSQILAVNESCRPGPGSRPVLIECSKAYLLQSAGVVTAPWCRAGT